MSKPLMNKCPAGNHPEHFGICQSWVAIESAADRVGMRILWNGKINKTFTFVFRKQKYKVKVTRTK